MSQVLAELLALHKLETIEQGIYRGQSQDLGFTALFGGQVMGQALAAAKKTVEPERDVHSFHCYFLRAGDANHPVVYEVENIRNGRSFCTRRVKAIQHGNVIFHLSSSFHVAEDGFEHQTPMPEVAGPEGLPSGLDIHRAYAEHIPAPLREKFTSEKPILMRFVTPYNPFEPQKMPAKCYVWIKANGDLPDDPAVHQYLLAYASDFNFLPTALLPHGETYMNPRLQMASLDHAMWFHRPFRMDDWLLYAIDSPSASNARGLVRGEIFNRQGHLVASTAQEGLLRLHQQTTG